MKAVRAILLAAIVSGGSFGAAHAMHCYNVGNGEPKALSGTLEYVVFPGPPNFEDVQKGDTPEPTYVLRLEQPICISGDDFADPSREFDRVQLVGTKATWRLLKVNLSRRVTVTLTEQMAAETGHHHEPLVAWVTNVVPSARTMEFTDEYGTPATTIRAFYETLSDGQGEAASQMVVAEKRRSGPLAPGNLTRFYGKQGERRSFDGSSSAPSVFVAHYRYATANSICDGRAVVTTVVRGGRNYIRSIATSLAAMEHSKNGRVGGRRAHNVRSPPRSRPLAT